MTWDANLSLAALLAARGLVPAAALRELSPLWLGDPPRELGALLVERGLLTGSALHSARGSAATLVTPEPALLATRVAAGRSPAPAAELTPAPAERYLLGREIGSGGIGRVVETADREIGRTVALKLAHPGSPDHALERFRAEARITGRLEHPNIVPVHEMGTLPGTREVFFCMKRIVGRDMHDVIRDGKWKMRRLVEAFRDVCRAVAYAHSKGVIHRDLKPANVMLGDFGETLVVDWGLAKEIGAPETRPEDGTARGTSSSTNVRQSGSSLTVAGDVLGTPAYMPPEQARGKVEEVDQLSDVYSLGAILFEILSGKPPFLGKTQLETLLKVIEDPVAPLPDAPPELAAICFRALAKKKADRWPSAAALEAEVEAWLEGTRERERRDRVANEQTEVAREALGAWRRLRGEAREAAANARALREAGKPAAPPAEKRPIWEAEDRAKSLDSDAIGAFSAANAALASALSNAPEHPGARRLRAELFWERTLEAEAAGDAKGALLNRRLAEQFNDGSLDAALRGDGGLAVRARAYPCRCLGDGREVRPDELSVEGFHPWSGRRLGDDADQRGREWEPTEPVRLKVHGRPCEPRDLAGAEVWAFRFEERDRVQVPATPPVVAHGRTEGPPVPAAALDRLFGDSPYRPTGPGLYLGRTPLAARPWPMGSWLLVLSAPGFEPARVPVLVSRQELCETAVTLFAPGEIPEGFAPVPEGPFLFQGDAGNPYSEPAEVRDLTDVFFSKFDVTCADYAAFMNDVQKHDPAAAAKLAPRESPGGGPSWAFDGKRWSAPTAAWRAAAAPDVSARAKPLAYAGLDWLDDWPIFGVDWSDAAAYAKWIAERTGRLICLPPESWWEKAARGPDRRFFPWGNTTDPAFSNTNASQPVSMRPCPVTDFPLDESPYGLRGLGGNVQQWTLAESERGGRRWAIIRGVSWPQSTAQARASIRTAATREYVNFTVGFRLAAAVKIPG
ncbi:MAG: SUMF1/EgtB/PvdO family nonheme iron enzyme [Planctomycetes bacterium]|nr:SUMF1/EgtB/PvdO family nonheme iron enzyme [Planctomycetota bacterium]